MKPLNDQYKSNKQPIAVIFVIYRKESKAKGNFAISPIRMAKKYSRVYLLEYTREQIILASKFNP